jgi:hypothetical protein
MIWFELGTVGALLVVVSWFTVWSTRREKEVEREVSQRPGFTWPYAKLLDVLEARHFRVRSTPFNRPWRAGRLWVSFDKKDDGSIRVAFLLHIGDGQRAELPAGSRLRIEAGLPDELDERLDALVGPHRAAVGTLAAHVLVVMDDEQPVTLRFDVAGDDVEAFTRALDVVEALAAAI